MTELRDQLAHAGVAIAIILLAQLGFIGCALAGFAIGMVREITEEGEVTLDAFRRIFASHRSLTDLSAWTLGGAIVGFLI